MYVGDHLVRTDVTAFSTQHTYQSKFHTSKTFSVLKYCHNLVALDIGHNEVSDLSFLEDLPQLKVLILAANNIRILPRWQSWKIWNISNCSSTTFPT